MCNCAANEEPPTSSLATEVEVRYSSWTSEPASLASIWPWILHRIVRYRVANRCRCFLLRRCFDRVTSATTQPNIFLSAIQAASNIAVEKDRQTLILLLMSRLTNSELVLGKLFSSLLSIGVMLITSLPIFMLIVLFGGTSFEQVGWQWCSKLVTHLPHQIASLHACKGL